MLKDGLINDWQSEKQSERLSDEMPHNRVIIKSKQLLSRCDAKRVAYFIRRHLGVAYIKQSPGQTV